MRPSILVALLCAMTVGCGSSSNQTDMPSGTDMASLPTLTVNNTLSWCTVTVTVGTGAPTMFTAPSQAFQAPEGTIITLSATPNPGFIQVVWTGTTTSNGSMATYTMTSAAGQMVTACCPFPNGTGC